MVDRYFAYFMLRFDPDLVKTSEPIMAYPDKAFEDDHAKALRYKQAIRRTLNGNKFTFGSYIAMVKSGEINVTATKEYDGHFLINQETRPRNICNPKGDGFCLLAAVQSYFWKAIKKAEPGFI